MISTRLFYYSFIVENTLNADLKTVQVRNNFKNLGDFSD